jgi:putative ABC transport system permease protein
MTIFQQLREALVSLAHNKLRSGLTMLGIVIGVAAVIAMLAIGRGAQRSIDESIQAAGSNLLFINSGGRNVRNPKPLLMGDLDAIADPMNAPSVGLVAPMINSREDVSYNNLVFNSSIVGTKPEIALMRNLVLTEGEFFAESDVSGRNAVIVIGSDVALNLFNDTQGIVGSKVRILNQSFTVIGVLESKGGGMMGSSDSTIYVPITTAQSRLVRRAARDRIDQIVVQAASTDAVPSAIEEVSAILRERHKTRVGADDFTILNQQDILNTATSVTGVLTSFLGGIAGISLLVGGIGIMNIMFVTVTERTREIGLRKAVGARKIDILVQFLVESALLSLFGGIIGIGMAWVIANLVSQVAAASNANIKPELGIDAILVATLFSAAIGIFFGIYPASRAANLAPVEALRTE